MTTEAPEGSDERRAAREYLHGTALFAADFGLSYREWLATVPQVELDRVSARDLDALFHLVWAPNPLGYR